MVETSRVKIIPLNEHQLMQYLRADDLLEEELGLARTGRIINAGIKDMVEKTTLPRIMNAPHDHFLYYTFWLVVDKESNAIVAELGFKGPPNKKGEIEIGYGTMPAQQNKGFMKEAVAGMLDWARQKKEIRGILAETSKSNMASIHVVKGNGFQQFDVKGDMLWWRKDVG